MSVRTAMVQDSFVQVKPLTKLSVERKELTVKVTIVAECPTLEGALGEVKAIAERMSEEERGL